jgi:hypothetical protein
MSVSLEQELEEYRRNIVTDAYHMSIGELSNLYRDGELDIHPEFQRIFRWTDEQKTRLIESILLGIPLPSIFVAQSEDGIWDVVDGVQRLSTIFQFMGILKDDQGVAVEPFICGEPPFLKSMLGVSYESGDASLSTAQRLDFKRARIDVKIIKRQSDNRAKYDLFQRLNSYGSEATAQELRNCLIVSISPSHYKWFSDLCKTSDFQEVIDLPEKLSDEQYDMELALRFICFRKMPEIELGKVNNLGEYLTKYVIELCEFDDRQIETETRVFERTFKILKESAGPSMLRRWNEVHERIEGPFSLVAFETLAMGIGHFDAPARITPTVALAKRSELWLDSNFMPRKFAGQRGAARLRKTIPFGRSLFQK